MKEFFIIYWLVAVISVYAIQFFRDRKLRKSYPLVMYGEDMLASMEPVGKRIAKHLTVVFLFSLAIPFVVPYLIFKKRKIGSPCPKKNEGQAINHHKIQPL